MSTKTKEKPAAAPVKTRAPKVEFSVVEAAVLAQLKGKKDVQSKHIQDATGYNAGRVHQVLKVLLDEQKVARKQLTREQVPGYKAGALPFAYTLK